MTLKSITRQDCMHFDMTDPLASLRMAFHPPQAGKIHLDGSSIGAMPSTLPERMIRFLLEEWNGLRSHGWMEGD
jgi:kynureninase